MSVQKTPLETKSLDPKSRTIRSLGASKLLRPWRNHNCEFGENMINWKYLIQPDRDGAHHFGGFWRLTICRLKRHQSSMSRCIFARSICLFLGWVNMYFAKCMKGNFLWLNQSKVLWHSVCLGYLRCRNSLVTMLRPGRHLGLKIEELYFRFPINLISTGGVSQPFPNISCHPEDEARNNRSDRNLQRGMQVTAFDWSRLLNQFLWPLTHPAMMWP